jgi:hypothetical protein
MDAIACVALGNLHHQRLDVAVEHISERLVFASEFAEVDRLNVQGRSRNLRKAKLLPPVAHVEA